MATMRVWIKPSSCTYCRRRLLDMKDHVVPRAHGGPDADWNLVPVCKVCNGMLSSCFPARDGDSIARIRWKKTLLVRRWQRALRANRAWRRLTADQRWEEVRRGSGWWTRYLPRSLQLEYPRLRADRPNECVVGEGAAARWRVRRRRRCPPRANSSG